MLSVELERQTASTPAYTWLSCSSHIQRNGCEKHRGVHRERHESLFFTANFKEKFFYSLHEGFFLRKYVLMVINQNVLYHRGEQTFPTATPSLSIPRRSEFPPVSQGGSLHKRVSGSSLKCT